MNQENKERRFTFIIGLLGTLMDHFLVPHKSVSAHNCILATKAMHCTLRYTPEYKRFTCCSS